MSGRDDIAPQSSQPSDRVLQPGNLHWRIFTPANAVAVEFLYHTAVLLAGCLVLLCAAVALDVLAAYAAAGGWFLWPLAWIARVLSYGLVIVDLALFGFLFLTESWRVFRGGFPALKP
jgi:hypothetical protein